MLGSLHMALGFLNCIDSLDSLSNCYIDMACIVRSDDISITRSERLTVNAFLPLFLHYPGGRPVSKFRFMIHICGIDMAGIVMYW